MKVKELFLQDFRCFNYLEIKFHPSLTVIVAENGYGKTTILDAIAVAFGRLLTKLPKISGIAIKESDIRIGENNKVEPFAQYVIDVVDFSGQAITWSAGRRRDSSNQSFLKIKVPSKQFEKMKVGFREIDKFTNDLIDKFNSDVGYKMPLIVYYGTNRAILEEVQRRRNFKKEFSRFESLVSALNPTARFKDAFEWFNAMEDLERREQQRQKNFDYRLPELDVVRSAIESMLPGFSHPRTEIRPLRFVIDQLMDDGTVRTFRVSQLSDGYRVMLGLVMDLARRMAQANPPLVYDTSDGRDTTDPLKMEAIVLIDEIDLHLHPKWQQRVLIDLQRTFENCQFIVTTHSPQVLTTVRKESIRILNRRAGEMGLNIPAHETYAQESRTALEDVLDVNSRPPLDINQQLLKYLKLVESGEDNSESAKNLRAIVEESLGAGDPQLQLADMLIARNAARRSKE